MALIVSDGLAEDLIRSFQQLVCSEGHYKTLVEKYNSEMQNGLVDVEDDEIRTAHIEKLNSAIQELNQISEIRREMMLYLMKQYEKSDKNYWCLVKHLAAAEYTAFECYQASDNNAELLNMWLTTRARFLHAVTRWLGTEISDCAACVGDTLKGEHDG